MSEPFLRIYGSNDWCPQPGNDGSCYLLDDSIMIDTGWKGVTHLIDDKIDPLCAKLMLFTHLHPDHRMALPQLLMYWRIKKGSLEELTIAGPAERIQTLYDHAYDFVFHDTDERPKHANILPVSAGDILETPTHIIEAADSLHDVPGRMYRITHKHSGRIIGFTGDTTYSDRIGAFFRGVHTLVCECTLGPIPKAQAKHGTLNHMDLWEVARVANAAQPEQLVLTHSTKDREKTLELLQPLISCDAFWAEPNDMLIY